MLAADKESRNAVKAGRANSFSPEGLELMGFAAKDTDLGSLLSSTSFKKKNDTGFLMRLFVV